MAEAPDARTTLRTIPRIFTPEEANALVARLEDAFLRIDPKLVRLRELQDLIEDDEAYWHADPSRAPPQEQAAHAALLAELGRTKALLDEELATITGLGAEVKDVHMGLVDFYAQREGDIVYLCWQRGEPRVGHWHPLEGGFAGRRPLEGPSKPEP